jgi:hypothetical protein
MFLVCFLSSEEINTCLKTVTKHNLLSIALVHRNLGYLN